MDSNTAYKGIPLPLWKSDKLLSKLTEHELIELHGVMYSALLDCVEDRVANSEMIEAKLVIDHIKDNLGNEPKS